MKKSLIKIFITRQIPDAGIDLLRKKNYHIKIYGKDDPIPKTELIKNVKDADAVISLLTDSFDSSVINKMMKCKIIANYAVGFNNIDVEYAKGKGIVITNTPDVLTDSTADLAIALALTCARRIFEGDSLVRSGKFNGWKPKLLLGIELRNKVFGILGAGRIGTAAAIRAKAFGSKIIYYSKSKNEKLENDLNAERVSLSKLLKVSDFISIHLPLNEKTHHLLDKNNLNLIKKNAVLINTARGDIVDEKELIHLLKAKKIFAAGLDVYENESNINPRLFELPNVVLLPHIGSATEDSRNQMAELTALNVINVLEGKRPVSPVT